MLMSWGRPTVAGRVNAGFFFHRQCGSITHINWIVGRPVRHELLTAVPLPRVRLPVFTFYGAHPGTPLTWISRDSKEAYAAGSGLRPPSSYAANDTTT